MPEAKLAREAELCYATMALATDYDCWHPDHDAVALATAMAVREVPRIEMALYHAVPGTERMAAGEFLQRDGTRLALSGEERELKEIVGVSDSGTGSTPEPRPTCINTMPICGIPISPGSRRSHRLSPCGSS